MFNCDRSFVIAAAIIIDIVFNYYLILSFNKYACFLYGLDVNVIVVCIVRLLLFRGMLLHFRKLEYT